MPRDRSYFWLLCCFLLSGFAALIYETAWTQEFAFVFGTSELAVVTVLAAYMGGLAAGAAIAGRYGARLSRPVLAYGALELGIALAALAVPLGIAGSRWLYVAMFGSQERLPDAGGLTTAVFYLACSFLILLVPTAMMGATLPLLVRHSVRTDQQIGGRIGVLYATNTAGALLGTIAAAFVLLPALGLRATIAAAAGVNALVFAAAWAVSRSAPPLPPESATASAATASGRARWILALIFASGFVSFTYEVLWVRVVGQVVGAGAQAFSTMLASFLAGIAIGAAVASRLAISRQRAALGFAVAQLAIAGCSVAAFAIVNRIPEFAAWVNDRGFSAIWAHIGACAMTLFPSALCIGATYPFAVRVLALGSDTAGPASARVYAANTVGSIVGSICAGFFLIPGLGFAGALTAAAAMNLFLAAAAALIFEPRRRVVAALATAGGVALAVSPPATPWRLLRASSMNTAFPAWGPVTYLGVGRSSTVLVNDQPRAWSLRTNGLPEAGMSKSKPNAGSAVTHWLTALPILARPEARSLLLVGFGGGVAIEVVPPSIERIDVVELEPEVIAANRLVAKGRWRDPLSDPRVHVHLNDARNALSLTSSHFDVIVSQPSHPWAGGAAHLYTREFFELARSRLSPDGVFLQWIGLSFVNEDLFRSMLATLIDVFPHVRVYAPPPHGSILFLASAAPFDMEHSVARALAATPAPFGELGVDAAEDVTANLLLDEAAVAELARGARLNRDGHNRLASYAARRGESSLVREIDGLIAPIDPLVRALPKNVDPFAVVRRLSGARAERVAKALVDPVERSVAVAIAEIEEGKPMGARRRLQEALRLDPGHAEARAAMLRLSAGAIADGGDPGKVLPTPLSGEEQALADGWVARARDPRKLVDGELAARLASVAPRNPLGMDAMRLRVQGMLASGDPALVKDADRLANEYLGLRSDPSSILLLAETAAAAGDPSVVLERLSELLGALDPRRADARGYVLRATALARATRVDDPELAWFRAQVLRGLGIGPRPGVARGAREN